MATTADSYATLSRAPRPHSTAPEPKGVQRSAAPIPESYRLSSPPTATATSTPASPVTLGLPAPAPGAPAMPFVATPTSRRRRHAKHLAPRILTKWTPTSPLLTVGKLRLRESRPLPTYGGPSSYPLASAATHVTMATVVARGMFKLPAWPGRKGRRRPDGNAGAAGGRLCDGPKPSAPPSPGFLGGHRGPGTPPRTNRTHSRTRLAQLPRGPRGSQPRPRWRQQRTPHPATRPALDGRLEASVVIVLISQVSEAAHLEKAGRLPTASELGSRGRHTRHVFQLSWPSGNLDLDVNLPI